MEDITINSCRICLSHEGLLSVMTFEQRDELTIADMIMELTNVIIDINDAFPSCVCLSCADRVRNAYKLKQDCENSDTKLREYYTVIDPQSEIYVINEPKTFDLDFDIKPQVQYSQPSELMEVQVEIKKEDNEANENVNYNTGERETQIINDVQSESPVTATTTTETTKEEDEDDKKSIKEESETIKQPIKIKITTTRLGKQRTTKLTTRNDSINNKSDGGKDESTESLQCEYCDKIFQYRASLSNHMRVHKAIPHQCTVCMKEFKLRQNLTNHMRTHTGEKPYECDICSKKFSTRSNVFNHRRTHSDEKPYVCDVCGKQFPTISHLRNHNLSHVPISERKYKCEKCNKTFRDRKIFKRHLNIHNGIRNEMCEICGKKFCNKNDVTRHHKTVHLGIKKYVCSVCSKPFSNSSNLESHFRIHTGEKPFACKYCDAKFNQSTPLVKHTKIHIERGDQMRTFIEVKEPID